MQASKLTRPALILLVASAAFAQRVEETDKSVTLTGSWISTNDPAASGGSYAVSGNVGDTATFSFTGTGITLYRTMDPTGGAASVTIDGKPAGFILFYFNQRAYQVPAVIDQLASGPHQIVLTVTTNAPVNTTGNNVYIDSFETPVTFAPSSLQMTAINVVNQIKTQAGLPAANLSTALDLAAQGHANYLANNNLGGHDEDPATAGFIGADPTFRAFYYGYPSAGTEDASPGADPTVAISSLWMATVYHRVPFMQYSLTDIGFGGAVAGSVQAGVIDFGSQHGTSPAAVTTVTWPANNQTNVPAAFSAESPNPVAGAINLGFPVSLHVTQSATATAPANTPAPNGTGTLTDMNGNAVSVTYLDRSNDPNGFLTGDDYFIVPNQPLTAGMIYTATITATDTYGNPINTTWKFSTVPASSFLYSPFAFTPQATQESIQWTTAGPVTSAQVVYGTTTAYGSTVAGAAADGVTFLATLTGLTPSTTYHFQVVNVDAAGNTVSSPDATFTTPAQ